MKKYDVLLKGRMLRHWQPVLKEWSFLVRRSYVRTKGRYPSYIFRERANIGVLAAAAWRNGWVAIEEGRSAKKHKRSANVEFAGRTDLLLWHGKRREPFDIVEAKFTRQSVLSTYTEKVQRKIDEAFEGAGRTFNIKKPVIAYRYVGLTFIDLTILDIDYDKSKIESDWKEYINHMQKEVDFNALAWSLPGPAKLKYDRQEKKHLGLILIAEAWG